MYHSIATYKLKGSIDTDTLISATSQLIRTYCPIKISIKEKKKILQNIFKYKILPSDTSEESIINIIIDDIDETENNQSIKFLLYHRMNSIDWYFCVVLKDILCEDDEIRIILHNLESIYYSLINQHCLSLDILHSITYIDTRSDIYQDVFIRTMPLKCWKNSIVKQCKKKHIQFNLLNTQTTFIDSLVNDLKTSSMNVLLAFFSILMYRYVVPMDSINICVPIFSKEFQSIRQFSISIYENSFEQIIRSINEAIQSNNTEESLRNIPLFIYKEKCEISNIFNCSNIEEIFIDSGYLQYSLVFIIEKLNNVYRCILEYDPNSFDLIIAEQMAIAFRNLVQYMNDNYYLSRYFDYNFLMTIPLLNDTNDWSIEGPYLNFDDNESMTINLSDLFERIANKNLNKICLQNSQYFINYRQCLALIFQLTEFLKEKYDFTSNIRIGMWMRNSFEYIIAILAAIKLNATFVPLDDNYPIDRLQYIIENAGINIILTTNNLMNNAIFNLPTIYIKLMDEKYLTIINIESSLLSNNVSSNSSIIKDDCYIIYTSGSTGRPKGITLNQNGLKNLAISQINLFSIKQTDIVAQYASISFDASLSEIFISLLTGAQLFIFQQDEKIGDKFIQIMNNFHINVLTIPRSLLSIYDPLQFPYLQTIICAGESCPSALAKKWLNIDKKFFNAYGPSETTVCSTIFQANSDQIYFDTIPIGYPIHNITLKVVDSNLNNVPIGMPGELLIGGIGVSQSGYIYPQDNTKFIKIKEENWYRSGDMVISLSSSIGFYLLYLGRMDRQVKINGCRIELSEIESIILSYPGVLNCIVIVHRCEMCIKNEYESSSIVAYIHIADDCDCNAESIRHYIQTFVAPFMVPSYLIVQKIWHLPISINGKVNINYLSNDTNIHNYHKKIYSIENNTMKEILSKIWCDILQCKIIPDSTITFAELGGNSLMLTKLFSLIMKHLNKTITFDCIHIHMNLNEMINAISNDKNDSITEMNLIIQDMNMNIHIKTQKLIFNSERNGKYPKILLTGASGYLGSFLLYELLIQTDSFIFCLIRASSQQECQRKIIQSFKKHNLLIDENDRLYQLITKRIICICTDLSKTDFMLENSLIEQIDYVLHCAAMINFNLSYKQLRQTNVQSTKYLLNICINRSIPIYYISSLSIFLFHHYYKQNKGDQIQINENVDPNLSSIFTGYGQSKFVADHLISKAFSQGQPGIIFRLGRITGSSKTGVGSTNDLFFLMLKGCIQCKAFPDLIFPLDLSPIDIVCQLIVYNIKDHWNTNHSKVNEIIHVINQNTLLFNQQFELLHQLGCCYEKLKPLNYDQWLQELDLYEQSSLNNALLPFLPFLKSNFWKYVHQWPKFISENNQNIINICPLELFTIYTKHWITNNLFQ